MIKKIVLLSVIVLMMFSSLLFANSYDVNTLILNIKDVNEPYELFLLLPKKYIKFAIEHDNLDIDYNGANTLKYSEIPSINLNGLNIQDDVYFYEKEEYVQIKFDTNTSNVYEFDIISEYNDMDFLYRIKSESKNDLLIIKNFKIKNNKCQMDYSYKNDTLTKQKKQTINVNFGIKMWQIIVIVLILVIVYIVIRKGNI